jgi:hypothetical protein
MSEFNETMFITAACIDGPIIDNIQIGPCVNEEFNLNAFKVRDSELSDYDEELYNEWKKREDELYDSIVSEDRLYYFYNEDTRESQNEKIKQEFKEYIADYEKGMEELQDERLMEEMREIELDNIGCGYNGGW